MFAADGLAELAGHTGGGVAVALAVQVRRTAIAQSAVIDHTLATDMQLCIVEQRIRILDTPAHLRETPLLRLEEEHRALRRGLAEARHQRIVTRRAGLFGILQAHHQFVARRDVGLPFEIAAALAETGERTRFSVAGAQIVHVLRRQAEREAHAFATARELCACGGGIIGARGHRAQPAVPRPVGAVELQFGGEHLHHAAHGVAAVQGAGRAAHDFDAVQALTIDQCDVLVRRIAEDGIVQTETVDQMQHLRAFQAAHDHHTLPGRGLLHKGADFAVQRVHRGLRRDFAQALAADDGGGRRHVKRGLRAPGRSDLHGVQAAHIAVAALTVGSGGGRPLQTRSLCIRLSSVGRHRIAGHQGQQGDRRRIY